MFTVMGKVVDYGVRSFVCSQGWFFRLENKVSGSIDSCGGVEEQ